MTTVIRCGTLFDATGADPSTGAEIVVDGGKIVAGPAPAGADVIDLSSAFVMPGIVDAHTHLSVYPGRGDQLGQLRQEPGRQALRAPESMRANLRAGTTTTRIMGEEDWLDVYARDAIANGELKGPNLVIATRPIAASNGHGRMKSSFDGVEEIRRAVRENLFHGADFIKVFATGGVSSGTGLEQAPYSLAEIRVAVEEAERAGTYVAVHAHTGPGLMASVEAGVRTIEHGGLATDAEVEAMLAADCWLVGTYSILFRPDGIELGDGGNPKVLSNLEIARERVTERMEKILSSGIKFALGTDSMHGHMATEIQTAIRFGVSPKEALLAATARGAEVVRLESRVGTIEAGKDADIIALDGNPLDDPTALDRVVFVMKGGERYEG